MNIRVCPPRNIATCARRNWELECVPQQSHHKGRERESGKGGTGPRETRAEGREERKGGGGEERTGGNAKRSGEEQGKRSDEGRGKKNHGNTHANPEDNKESMII